VGGVCNVQTRPQYLLICPLKWASTFH